MRPRPLRSQVSRGHSPTELACCSNGPAPVLPCEVPGDRKSREKGSGSVVPSPDSAHCSFLSPTVADVPHPVSLYQPPGAERWPGHSLCAEPDVSGAEGRVPKGSPSSSSHLFTLRDSSWFNEAWLQRISEDAGPNWRLKVTGGLYWGTDW